MAPVPDPVTNVVDPSVYVGRKPTMVMSFYATLQRSDLTTPYLVISMIVCQL